MLFNPSNSTRGTVLSGSEATFWTYSTTIENLWLAFHFWCYRLFCCFKDKYSHSNRENLLLPIQMQMSEKPKAFRHIFVAFVESTLSFEHFEWKRSLIGEVFLKLLTLKDVVT